MKKKSSSEAGTSTLAILLIGGMVAAAIVYLAVSNIYEKYLVANVQTYQAPVVLDLTPSPYPSPSLLPSPIAERKGPVQEKVGLEDLAGNNQNTLTRFNTLPKDPALTAQVNTLDKVIKEIGAFLTTDKNHYTFTKVNNYPVAWRSGAFDSFYRANGTGWATDTIPVVDGQFHVDSVMLGGTDEKMAKLGFTYDPYNSSPSTTKTFYRDFKRYYTRGNIVCAMSFPVAGKGWDYGVASFICTDQMAQAKQAEAKFASLKDSPVTVIAPGKQVGTFMKVNIGDVRGYGYPMLVRDLGSSVDGLATLLEDPSCEVLDKWKVSKQLIPQCFENIGEKDERHRDNINP